VCLLKTELELQQQQKQQHEAHKLLTAEGESVCAAES